MPWIGSLRDMSSRLAYDHRASHGSYLETVMESDVDAIARLTPLWIPYHAVPLFAQKQMLQPPAFAFHMDHTTKEVKAAFHSKWTCMPAGYAKRVTSRFLEWWFSPTPLMTDGTHAIGPVCHTCDEGGTFASKAPDARLMRGTECCTFGIGAYPSTGVAG